MRGLGTVLNVTTVATGSTVGVLFGGRVAERFRVTVMQGIGLLVLALGVTETLDTRNVVILLGSLLAGGLIGEALRLEDRLVAAGAAIERRVGPGVDAGTDGAGAERGSSSRFVEGFRVASIVFCVGPLTILGSIQDGLRHNIDLLATKSLLDGFAALAFATTLGWGVAASVVTIIVVQGGITAGAALLDNVLTARMVDEMSAVGGLMLVGIGLRLLDLKEIRVASFLPGLVVAPVLVALFAR
ncbi:MAG: uncharacterized protein QOI55_219 [Actinomycetota bacterium]|nr:uncharacterized protein [Actinomycetota bacterium]